MDKYIVVEEFAENGKSVGVMTLPHTWFRRNGWLGEGKNDGKRLGNDLGFWSINKTHNQNQVAAMDNFSIVLTKETTQPFRCKYRASFVDKEEVNIYLRYN